MSTLLVGGADYFRVREISKNTAIEASAGQTRLMAQRFHFSYEQMKYDTRMLSSTPPIQGLVRTSANGGLDPVDGSSTEEWRRRLSTIFSSMLASRPYYTQIRYIGVGDQGRELVRVNRTASGIEVVKGPDLQQKAQEPYFQLGISASPENVHFSEVTYNREFGKLGETLTPTVRAVLPILDTEERLFGMIVINADYEAMLRATLSEIAPKMDTLVVNNAGDYLSFSHTTSLMNFEFHEGVQAAAPAIVKEVLNAPGNERAFFSEDEMSYYVRVNTDPENSDAFIGVVARVPFAELFSNADKIRRDTLLLGALLSLICLFASLKLVQKWTAPLIAMTEEITRSKGDRKPENLPLERPDEIGDLARAFHDKTEELANKEAKLSAIVDKTVDGMLTIDEFGTIESYNRACADIFGYGPDEVLGQNVKMLMLMPDRRKHDGHLKKYRKTGQRRIIATGREVEGRRKDGSTVPLDLSVSEVQLADRRIFSGIVRDISERKEVEKMKDEFISTVNHELRTPLTSIQASLGLLKARAALQADEKTNRLLELSYDNCNRLSRLVNDILDIEKMAAGKMEYSLQLTDIQQIVTNVVERQRAYADTFGISLSSHFETMDIQVNLDRDRFDQALVNLLSNAVKFSHGGGTVDVRVALTSDGQVEVSVQDYGVGIPSAFHQKIFGKFSQADGSSTRAKNGTGLGLNITRRIIRDMEGEVNFTSREGTGSIFTITLPVCGSGRSAKASA